MVLKHFPLCKETEHVRVQEHLFAPHEETDLNILVKISVSCNFRRREYECF